MNTTPQEGVALAQTICRTAGDADTIEVVLCPPFTSLIAVYGVVHNTRVMLGAQNVSQHPNGAYTGEVSAEMLRGLVSHAIIGHSERRQHFGETDQMIAAKASAVVNAEMTAIVCVGEDDNERQRRRAERYVRRQVRQGLTGIEDPSKVVIAYEPIWAIGTGVSATIGQIEYMAASIREEVCEMYDQEVADGMRVLYGGSTNAGNIGQIVASPTVDGALVGGASLNDAEFSTMISIIAKAQADV